MSEAANNQIRSAVLAVARMENRYLVEWIEYHLNLGFSHIFICDNNFDHEENIGEFLNTNLDSSLLNHVTVFNHRNDGSLHRQMHYYSNYLWKYKNDYDWIAIIDVDEFITLSSESGLTSINELLSRPEFSDADQLFLNWMVYGDNGLVEYDNSGVLKRFAVPAAISPKNDQARINCHIKPIVNCHRLSAFPVFPCPHFMIGGKGHGGIKAITASGIACKIDAFQKPDYAVAYIRHYLTKSICEFMDRKICGRSEYKNDGKASITDFVSWIREFFDINEMTSEKFGIAVSYLVKYYTADEISSALHELESLTQERKRALND